MTSDINKANQSRAVRGMFGADYKANGIVQHDELAEVIVVKPTGFMTESCEIANALSKR